MKKTIKNEPDKPAELFRLDFISNMKVADSETLDTQTMFRFSEPWRQEWNCGVQVALDDDITCPKFRKVTQLIDQLPSTSRESEMAWQYDMDLLDEQWLVLLNRRLLRLGLAPVERRTFELVIEHLELSAHGKPTPVVKGPSEIEQDSSVCDVCRIPTWEDGNMIIFCDKCNVAVHQLCYGVKRIPKGEWFCRPCAQGARPQCTLCPSRGGALKSNSTHDKWVHVSCALWVPEVAFEDKETMEPAYGLETVPESRYALRCTLCINRTGACIQCNTRSCRSAYHVTCAQKHNVQLISYPGFESYCEKHTDPHRRIGSPSSQRAESIDERTCGFSNDPKIWLSDVTSYFLHESSFDLPQYTAQGLFYYWRLKKMSKFGRPFIRLADSDNIVQRKHDEHLTRRVHLLMFLRQNMEKARNLCYMLERREKLKRQYYATAHEHSRLIFEHYKTGPGGKDPKSTSVLKTSHKENVKRSLAKAGIWTNRSHLDFYRLKPMKWRNQSAVGAKVVHTANDSTAYKKSGSEDMEKHTRTTSTASANKHFPPNQHSDTATGQKCVTSNTSATLRKSNVTFASVSANNLFHRNNRHHSNLVPSRKASKQARLFARNKENRERLSLGPPPLLSKRRRRSVVHYSPT